jgi:signal transduction histidine kinase
MVRIVTNVTDDGRGFDIDTTGVGKRVSWGLKGMEERTSLLGGSFIVRSRRGERTEIIVSIPYLQEETDENPPSVG